MLEASSEATPESVRKSEEAITGLMSITSRRLAELDASGCRKAERLRTLQLAEATAIANGGSIMNSEDSGPDINDRIEILRTRIDLLRIDRKRRGIIDEMARMLVAAIPPEKIRSGTARQARAFIDSNTIHDQTSAWRIEELQAAIEQLESSRNEAVSPIAEPSILEVAN